MDETEENLHMSEDPFLDGDESVIAKVNQEPTMFEGMTYIINALGEKYRFYGILWIFWLQRKINTKN